MLLDRLEMYLSSGLEINKSLRISGEGLKKRHQSAITSLLSDVESGGTLCGGLSKHIGISSTTYGLVEYGELSGTLTKSLLSAKNLLEREDELFKKCFGAMIYPVIIGVFAILLTLGLIRGVMPQIIPVLKSLNVQLPFITRTLIYISEIITSYGLYIIAGVILLVVVARIILKRSRFVRAFCQRMLISSPILGRLIYQYHLAVFLHSCGTLVCSGLSVRDSYEKSIRTVSLYPLGNFLRGRSDMVARGLSFGSVMIDSRHPAYITQLLMAGEASGTLGLSITRAGGILDREIEHVLKKLTSLVEPVMMIGIGLVVGAIALSIMLPIYNISGALQK